MDERTRTDLHHIAAQVRDRCIALALDAYEDAGIRGLCAEGRWEAAVVALRSADIAFLARDLTEPAGAESNDHTAERAPGDKPGKES